MNILIIIALLLGVVVVIRLMNVSQIAALLAGEDEVEEQSRQTSMNGFGMMVFMVVGLAMMVYLTIKYQSILLPKSASVHGDQIDFLLNINFIIIGIVFVITQIMLFFFVFKFQHNKNRTALFYPENHKLELVWTVIPAIVLSVLIVTGLKEWNKMTQGHPQDGMVVQVYGYQFNWIARYSGKDNKLGRSFYKLITDDNPLGIDFSDPAAKDDIITKGAEMHLPKGIPIQFEFNAREVIHSAYFPHFRTQMNCVPGMTTNFYMEPSITTSEMRGITKNDKFDYVLLCNKVCGVAHYNMKMTVVVDEPADFKKWLKGEKPAVPANPTASETVRETATPATKI